MDTRPARPVDRSLRTKYLAVFLSIIVVASYSSFNHGQEWSILSKLSNKRYESAVVQYNEDIYTFNGFGNGLQIEPTVERFDAATKTWSIVGNTSVALGNALTHSGVVRTGQDVWIIGGRIGNHPGQVTSKVWIFNLDTLEWSEGPSLPVPGAAGGAAMVNGKIHWFGGVDPQANCDVPNHFVYDLASEENSWQDFTSTAPMPVPRNHFGTVVHDGLIYAIGGQFGHDNCQQLPGPSGLDTSVVHAFDPSTNLWEQKASLPNPNSHFESSVFSYDRSIFVLGGQINGSNIFRYDTANDVWISAAQLPEALDGAIARIVDDRLVVAGGGAPDFHNVIDTTRDTAVSAVLGNDDASDSVSGLMSVEAEYFDQKEDTATHTWVTNNLSAASNDASVTTTPDSGTLRPNESNSPRLSYLLNFDRAGTWYVWVRGWGDTDETGEGRSDSVHIGLDGLLSGTADKIDSFPQGWHWSNNTRDGERATLELASPGLHSVDMWMREDGLSVDKIILTTDANFVPTGEQGDVGAPIVDAGQDQTADLTEGGSVALSGTVSDGGLPTGELTIGWEKLSGPGTVVFLDNESATTTATFSAPGNYVLELSADDGQFSSKDRVTISVIDSSNNASSTVRINVGGASLVSNAGDWSPDAAYVNTGNIYATTQSIDTSGVPSNVPSAVFQSERWDPASGSEMVFTVPLANGDYEARLYFAEIYSGAYSVGSRVFDVVMEGQTVLSNMDVYGEVGSNTALMKVIPVTVSDGALNIEFIHVVENPAIKGIEILTAGGLGNQNTPPVVDAGVDQSLDLASGSTINLNGSYMDDGLPSGTSVLTRWSVVDGAGLVSFGSADSLQTSVEFSIDGSYTLSLTVNDGQFSVTDTLQINVFDNSITNTPPEVDAGADQNLNLAQGNSFALSGSYLDDGEPAGGEVVAQWSATKNAEWRNVVTSDGSMVVPRHEAGGVVYEGKLYVLGGRGSRAVSVYDPAANSWAHLSPPPIALNHFQPVVFQDKIWVIAAFTGSYPDETSVQQIYSYSPQTDTWSVEGLIPEERLRGSAGAVLHEGLIYLIGGNTNGHRLGAVAWFDSYDPATGQWQILPDANSARDHVTVAVSNNKLVVAGGRSSEFPVTWANMLSATDVFDFDAGSWATAADIPTLRAGAMTVSVDEEVWVIGGETSADNSALATVEAYDVQDESWRSLDSLNTGLHGGAVGILGNEIHVVTGSENRGGSPESFSHQTLDISDSVVISDASSLQTSATFESPGSYTFELEVTDGELTGMDSMVVNVVDDALPQNTAPSVEAGTDLSTDLATGGETVTLSAVITDDGLPNGSLTVSWSKLSGPGTVEFGDTGSRTTTATFDTVGNYILELSVDDGQYTVKDLITIFVSDSSGNSPVGFIEREAENFDEKSDTQTHAWVINNLEGASNGASMITNPDTGVLRQDASNSPRLSYLVDFDRAGTWFVWVRGWGDTNEAGEGRSDSVHIGLNGQLGGTADKIDPFPRDWSWSNSTRDGVRATLEIESPGVHSVDMWMREDGLSVDKFVLTTDASFIPTGENANPGAPVVDAGSDQNADISEGASVVLSGTVSDDGLPTDELTIGWVQLSGPGTVEFDDDKSVSTVATFSALGTYVLELSADDGLFTSTDRVEVNVYDASAGDYVFTESEGIVVMEVETVAPEGDWSLETSIDGYTGSGYYVWRGANNFPVSAAGEGVITYSFYVNNPGNYELRWRSRITIGNDSTEHNDNWVRFATGTNVPGEEPLAGWTKVFQNQLNTWSWLARTVDHVAKPIRQFFDAGLHTLEISGRSNGHGIDRVVLFNYPAVSFSESLFTNLPESDPFLQ